MREQLGTALGERTPSSGGADAGASTTQESLVRFGDVSLFVSWPPNSVTEPPSRLTRHSEPSSAAADRELRYQLQAEDLLLTRWRGKRVVVVPDGSTDTFALKDLHTILPRLIAVGQQIAPSGAPLYFALHLGRLTASRHARRHAQQSDDSGRLAGRPVLSTEQFRALLNEVDAVRASTGLVVGERDPKVLDGALLAREPAYFEHYSPARRRRGYLMFDPRFSLLIDAPESDVRLLLSMVQQATLEPGGITAASYGAVLARVSLWDANADTEASLDDLVVISRSNRAATVGEVLLSVALAAVSVVLAVTQAQHLTPKQLVYPLGLYAAAACLYAIFAITERRLFARIGFGLLVIATLLGVMMWLDPVAAAQLLPAR